MRRAIVTISLAVAIITMITSNQLPIYASPTTEDDGWTEGDYQGTESEQEQQAQDDWEDAGRPGDNNDNNDDDNDDNSDLPSCAYLVVKDCVLNDLGQTCEVGTDEDACQDIFYGYDNPNYKPGEKIDPNKDSKTSGSSNNDNNDNSNSDNIPECKRGVLQYCKLSGNTGLLCGVEDLEQGGGYNPNVIGDGHACHDVYVGTYNQLEYCNDGTYVVSCGSVGVYPGIP